MSGHELDFQILDERSKEGVEKLGKGDAAGARKVFEGVLAEVKSMTYNGPGGSAEMAFDMGQQERVEETQRNLAAALALEKEMLHPLWQQVIAAAQQLSAAEHNLATAEAYSDRGSAEAYEDEVQSSQAALKEKYATYTSAAKAAGVEPKNVNDAPQRSGDSITDAFRRFDADGNGQISRSELAIVLKELGPDTWDDARIDKLFSSFGSAEGSGIQYEDFIKWVVTIGQTTQNKTMAKWSSVTVDEIVASWGSFDVASVSNEAIYDNDDGDTHYIKLKVDGGYMDYHDYMEGSPPAYITDKVTGVYQIIRCLDTAGDHLVLLRPKHLSGEAAGLCGCSVYGHDIENQDKIVFLDRDLKTIRLEKGSTSKLNVYILRRTCMELGVELA